VEWIHVTQDRNQRWKEVREFFGPHKRRGICWPAVSFSRTTIFAAFATFVSNSGDGLLMCTHCLSYLTLIQGNLSMLATCGFSQTQPPYRKLC